MINPQHDPTHSFHVRFSPWTARLAFAAAGLTLLLITVGGLVTNTDSGLACPDWPTCFGEPFPKLVGGVLMEHGHRYLGAAVGFLALLLTLEVLRHHGQLKLGLLAAGVATPIILAASFWAGSVKHHSGDLPLLPSLLVLAGYLLGLAALLRARREGKLAVALLLIVITQGLFGGLTVLYKLPPTVLVLHTGTSMIVLSLLLVIGLRLAEGDQHPHGAPIGRPFADAVAAQGGRGLLLLCAGAVYLQILIGATVRHTGAGLICTDLPLCKGALWPLGVHPAVHLHMVHRALALVVGALVLWAGLRAARLAAEDGLARKLGLALPWLVLAQIGLGVLTIATLKELAPVTLHLLVGALLLSSCVALWARARPALHAPAAEGAVAASSAGVAPSSAGVAPSSAGVAPSSAGVVPSSAGVAAPGSLVGAGSARAGPT